MKKWSIALLVLVLITIVSIYFFIPSELVISKSVQVNCSSTGIARVLADENRWLKWWPEKNKVNSRALDYDGFSYQPGQKFYKSYEVIISDKGFSEPSRINVIKTSMESTIIEWKCQFASTLNPLKRYKQYRRAVQINKNMVAILNHVQAFLNDNFNVYDVNIHQIISKDSTLITTKRITGTYPSTGMIYEMIGLLKKHIAEEGAAMNNVPMLNVKTLPNQTFQTTVAIPVNRVLRETPTIVNKRFVPWKTLVGDVKGGVSTIQHAQQQMVLYIEDYQRSAFGIPFELLITDRSLEADTSKWVTRICQAVS